MTRNEWDMHCHTVYSDGTYSPEELIIQAKEKGLAGVAITDHDTTASWQDAKAASLAFGYPLIRGTEITAESGKTSVHVLAYLFDCEDKAALGLFAQTRRARQERIRTMVDRIARDYPITWESVRAQIRNGEDTTVGRPHIADALVEAGVYPDRSAAFTGIISTHSPYYVPVFSPDVETVVSTMKQAGGVVVVAHPGAVSRNRFLLSDGEIGRLARLGLDGLEVYHRDNPPEQRRRLSALAERFGLLATGGPDWHGKGKPNELGENTTGIETVDEIISRGVIRVLP